MNPTAADPPRTTIDCGISLMLGEPFEQAASPLFDDSLIDVVEWSFDMGWGLPELPSWLQSMLSEFSQRDAVLGHGVSFSALSGRWSNRQQAWLERFQAEVARTPMRQVSEHFGFMDAGDFHQSAPLPVPRNEATLRVGQDRLEKLAQAAAVPVGLENLAFAFSIDDVRGQGEFLDELLEPVHGFLLLDLHNLYCQLCNFDCEADELLASYPLSRVREMHVSGGSWSESAFSSPESHDPKTVRRDTHDHSVPDEVFALLESAIGRCPNLEAVILEQLGTALVTDAQQCQFRDDFMRMREVVGRTSPRSARNHRFSCE